MGATSRYRASIRLERGRIANLQTAILTNRGDDDFFIQKAIGWALRDYGKVNSEWGVLLSQITCSRPWHGGKGVNICEWNL
ncbi:DNA alkylation repair protein [Lactiplantibacillus plantarum]|uniref:DNA alkylation repair protein n=2 Tax=Lactiplantibacillus plantarum TaxID=1590 RepID=UPI0035C7545F|nr:hypothetical protein [Lactiplantibacillus plantarum]